ncbi:MAG: hypothetical protein GY953_35310, partial [bacterium]|nr:hypothetical protein [bacterium]
FLGRVLRQLHTPSVEVEGPPTVEVVRRTKDGRQLLHLLNATGMQLASDYSAIDFIPPAGPLRIRLRLPRAPRRITLEPAGRPLEGTWQDGIWTTTLNRVHIHAILAWDA